MTGQAPRDWDAATYDRLSDPQVAMALPVLDRLDLRGDETVLDAGCGSGRVTEMLLERLPNGHVIAVDAAPSMVEEARAALGDRATVFQSDLQELTVPEPVDAAFSNAVFIAVTSASALLRTTSRPGVSTSASRPIFSKVSRRMRSWSSVSERYFCHSFLTSAFSADSMACL